MLIQKPMDAGDIVSIKLVNGDEIVGRLVSQDSSGCVIAKPVLVEVRPVGPQQVSLAFMPFMVSTDDEATVTFAAGNILTKPIKSRADVASNYRRATSNIEMASPHNTSGLVI